MVMNTRNLLFGLTVHQKNTDIGLLAFRLYAGLALALLHGWGKVPPRPGFVARVADLGFPAPELFAWIGAVAEFAGGLLLALGLLTRPAMLLVLVHFTIVVLVAHAGDTLRERELPLFFWATALLYLLAGAGRYSLDALLARRT
jgi:putative oxidoreductase